MIPPNPEPLVRPEDRLREPEAMTECLPDEMDGVVR